MTMAMPRRNGMTRKQRRLTLIGLAGVRARRRRRADPLCALRPHRLLQFAERRDRQEAAAGHAASASAGWSSAGSLVKRHDGNVAFAVTDGNAVGAGHLSRASFPISSAKGRASSPKASCAGDGAFDADTVLAKHDERYMPREVVDALKKQGVLAGDHGRRHGASRGSGTPMIAELGHFALVLALALALVQSTVPFFGALQGDAAADGGAPRRRR